MTLLRLCVSSLRAAVPVFLLNSVALDNVRNLSPGECIKFDPLLNYTVCRVVEHFAAINHVLRMPVVVFVIAERCDAVLREKKHLGTREAAHRVAAA